jgi:hypothetical protein
LFDRAKRDLYTQNRLKPKIAMEKESGSSHNSVIEQIVVAGSSSPRNVETRLTQ